VIRNAAHRLKRLEARAAASVSRGHPAQATAAFDLNWIKFGESCQWAEWASLFFDWADVYDPNTLTNFLYNRFGYRAGSRAAIKFQPGR